MNMPLRHPIHPDTELQGIIFDRDGTLLDLNATWGRAMAEATNTICKDAQEKSRLAAELGLDLQTKTFTKDSLTPSASIAETSLRIARVVDPEEFGNILRPLAAKHIEAAKGAESLLAKLSQREISLALATNDRENSAIKTLKHLDWAKYFISVKGCDSGFGSKPAPDMLLACVDELDLDIQNLVMFGDTSADLEAAAAANISYIQVGSHPKNTSKQADITLNNLTEAEDYLQI